MISTTTKQAVTSCDLILFSNFLKEKAAQDFPFPAKISVYTEGSNPLSLEKHNLPEPYKEAAPEIAKNNKAVTVANSLILPIKLSDDETGFLLCTVEDKNWLKELSREWLHDFREKMQREIEDYGQNFINQETGLYNRNPLISFIDNLKEEDSYSLFIVNTIFNRGNGLDSLQKIKKIANLIEITVPGMSFFIGQGIFMFISPPMDRKKRTQLGYKLQKVLKREPIKKVQIGCTVAKKGNNSLENIYKALAIAEKRGPYGLCDSSFFTDKGYLPFTLPAPLVLNNLRRHFKSVNQFSLFLFQRQDKNGFDFKKVDSLLNKSEKLIPESENSFFIFVAGKQSKTSSDKRMVEISHKLATQTESAILSGGCCYPLLNFSKTDIIRNCRKTLLHSSLYQEPQFAMFSHLTLNISGDWYFEEGDFRQAVKEYNLGLKIKTNEINLLNSIGVAMMEMNRHTSAINYFKRVLAQKNDNYMALANMGYAHQVKRNYQQAINYLEQAAEVLIKNKEPLSVEIIQQLCRLYCQESQYQKAIKSLSLWQKSADISNNFMYHRLYGEALHATKKYKKAIVILEKGLKIHPHDEESMSLLGLLYVERKEGSEAGMLLLEKALTINQSNPTTWFRYGKALLLQKNRKQDGISALKQCLKLKPKHRDAARVLKNICR